MLLFISKIAQDNYKIEQVKRRIALWIFIFLIIITISDMRLYYFQSEIDKVNTEINTIELTNMRHEIEMFKQNKNLSIESTKNQIHTLEASKEDLSSCSKKLSWAKFVSSLYVCFMTGFTFFMPESFLDKSIGFPGLIVVFIYLISAII